MAFEIKQNVYEHGGSRIWIQDKQGNRSLVADTHLDADFAEAVRMLCVEMGPAALAKARGR